MLDLFQIGCPDIVISVDFDESCMQQTEEIAEYLSSVDDVLTYYNENGEIKHVCISFLRIVYSICVKLAFAAGNKKLNGSVFFCLRIIL